MTEPGAVLEAAHTAIADLAAVLVAVRAGLGGECVRAGSHLEMGEIDLLSARDAVEKARLEIDLAGPAVADVRVTVPLSVGIDRAAEHGTRGHSRDGRRGGAVPPAGPASGWDAAARVPGTRPRRAVLGTRRHVARLAVGVSRSGRSWSTRAALERVLIRGDGTFIALQRIGTAMISQFRYAHWRYVTGRPRRRAAISEPRQSLPAKVSTRTRRRACTSANRPWRTTPRKRAAPR